MPAAPSPRKRAGGRSETSSREFLARSLPETGRLVGALDAEQRSRITLPFFSCRPSGGEGQGRGEGLALLAEALEPGSHPKVWQDLQREGLLGSRVTWA